MQILPADKGRSDFMRVAQAVTDMLNSNLRPGQAPISVEQFAQDYKFYDDTLEIVQTLSPSQSTYTFNPVRGLDTLTPTANLMDRSDLFAVTGVGIFFTRATYSSTSASLSAYGNYERFTFPHVAVFSGSNEQAGLLNVVNGIISLSVQNDQQWALPISRLVYKDLYVQSQISTSVFGGNGDPSQGILPLNSLVILDGENDNKVQISLPSGGTLANIDGNTNATTRNILVARLDGFRIRNTANGAFTGANCRAA